MCEKLELLDEGDHREALQNNFRVEHLHEVETRLLLLDNILAFKVFQSVDFNVDVVAVH